MEIIFAKIRDDRASLRCVRDDGSQTWSNTQHPTQVIHDLIHYAVETELNFQQAFYGLVAQGYDISGFGLPDDRRPAALRPANLPREAHQAEILVSILQAERMDGIEYPRFAAALVKACILQDVPPPSLSDTILDTIRIRVAQLCDQWQTLGETETLRLNFRLT